MCMCGVCILSNIVYCMLRSWLALSECTGLVVCVSVWMNIFEV